jgi:hypothetical protein
LAYAERYTMNIESDREVYSVYLQINLS